MQSKKQLFQLFTDIAHLNDTAWGNRAGSYDARKAAALVIEEALEKLHISNVLATKLGCTNSPREVAREIIKLASSSNLDDSDNCSVSDVGAFDSSLDAIYIEIGNMHMLGLTPNQMVDGLAIVHAANLKKQGTKDSEGKIIKPVGFAPPESLLQAILDKRVVK